MTETPDKTTLEKTQALDKAREIYRQICDYTPSPDKKAAHLVYDIGTLLNTARGKRENLRLLDPKWNDSGDEKTDQDQEMNFYFKVNFTANYCDKVNSLNRQINEIMNSEPDLKAGLGDKISELKRTYSRAAEPHGLIKLDVKDPGYKLSDEQKKRLFNEADYYNGEMEKLSSLANPSQAEQGMRNDCWLKLKNLKEVLLDEMPQPKTRQLAGVDKAASINISAVLSDAGSVETPGQLPQTSSALQK